MGPGGIGFLIALAVGAAVAFPLGEALRRHPLPFYGAAVVAVALYAWAQTSGVNLVGVRPLMAVVQRGYLASVFLAEVMFCGCLDETSPLRRRLQPVRGSLSILSFIFILGHLATYLPAYLPRLGALFSLKGNVAASLVVALALTVLFAALTVTSARAVRKAMSPRAWKALQRTAYLMVALMAAHVALVLGRSALSGGNVQARASLLAYLAVMLAYAFLRVRKAVRDRAKTRLR